MSESRDLWLSLCFWWNVNRGSIQKRTRIEKNGQDVSCGWPAVRGLGLRSVDDCSTKTTTTFPAAHHILSKGQRMINSWIEGVVSLDADYFILTHSEKPFERGEAVALVGRDKNSLVVQFLTDDDDINAECAHSVDFFIRLREEDVWAYLLYHCTTTSNGYAKIHWETSTRRFDQVFQAKKVSDLSPQLQLKFRKELQKKKKLRGKAGLS
jgi:hypothetical protein